jgi:hypothetical protein
MFIEAVTEVFPYGLPEWMGTFGRLAAMETPQWRIL